VVRFLLLRVVGSAGKIVKSSTSLPVPRVRRQPIFKPENGGKTRIEKILIHPLSFAVGPMDKQRTHRSSLSSVLHIVANEQTSTILMLVAAII
jgi:hypothetical protein